MFDLALLFNDYLGLPDVYQRVAKIPDDGKKSSVAITASVDQTEEECCMQ